MKHSGLTRAAYFSVCILLVHGSLNPREACADASFNRILADFLSAYSAFEVGGLRIVQTDLHSMDVIVTSKSMAKSDHVCAIKRSAYRYAFPVASWMPLLENQRGMAWVESRDRCAYLKEDSFYSVSGDELTAEAFESVLAAVYADRARISSYLQDVSDLSKNITAISVSNSEGNVSIRLLSAGCELVLRVELGQSGNFFLNSYSSEDVVCHHR